MSKMKTHALALAALLVIAGNSMAADPKNKSRQDDDSKPAAVDTRLTTMTTPTPYTGALQPELNLKDIATQNGQTGVGKDKTAAMGIDPGQASKPGQVGVLGTGTGVNSALKDLKTKIGEQGPVTGMRYGDTFQAGRINAGFQGGTGNFAGDRHGSASEDPPEVTQAKNEGAAEMLLREGGTPTGNWQTDIREVEYAQKVGTDGYAATKNLSWTERSNYWNAQAIIQKTGTKRPTEDSMGSGSFVPMGRQDIVNLNRNIGTKTGAAGGKDDGRTDQMATTGGSISGMVVRNKADGAVREEGVSSINLNKVLEINTKVNPGRQ